MERLSENAPEAEQATMTLSRLKNILDCNASLVSTVYPSEMCVEIKEGDNYVDYFFDRANWKVALRMITEEIKTRPNPLFRVEHWECVNFDGNFSSKMFYSLYNLRKKLPARQKQKADKRALKQLTDACGLKEIMGDLLLSELKLYNGNNSHNLKLINRARLLGLM